MNPDRMALNTPSPTPATPHTATATASTVHPADRTPGPDARAHAHAHAYDHAHAHPAGAVPPPPVVHELVRERVVYSPRRSRWPGVLGAAAIGALVAGAVVSSLYDDRSLGQRVDAGIAATQQGVQQGVDGVVQQGAAVSQQAAEALTDAGITAAVKTALAADPGLSALKIDVSTQDGVVKLSGPAPDAQARERAGMLAAAPKGVRSVDNGLTVATEPARNG